MAFQLNQKGIPETYALKGGTMAWKTAGYPLEGTTSNPIAPGSAPNPPTVTSNAPAPPNY